MIGALVRRSVSTALAAVLLAVPSAVLPAQGPPPGSTVTVSVLTFGPGEEVFERFGHIAIRVQQPSTGIDVAFNWGMFSFEQPHFIQRFLSGDTRYWMEGFNGAGFIAAYREQHREIWEQELALTPAQKDSLLKFLDFTKREENRYYRYDYYRDNCSTRVRDALDAIVGGAIRRAAEQKSNGVSYRSETLRLAKAYSTLNLGMDFVLGPRADARSTGWEELFVPMRLRDLLREVKVPGPDGTPIPLVAREVQLVNDPTYAEAKDVPSMVGFGATIGIIVAVLLLVLGSRLEGGSAAMRWGFVTVASLWNLVLSLSGMLLLYTGLFTRHFYMGANLNVLLATPLSLVVALMIPFAYRSGASTRTREVTVTLHLVAALCAIIGTIVTLAGPLAQANGSAVALLLPAHLALAWVGRMAFRGSERA